MTKEDFGGNNRKNNPSKGKKFCGFITATKNRNYFMSSQGEKSRSLSVPNLLFINFKPQNNSFQYFPSPAAPYRHADNAIFSKQGPSRRERSKADNNLS